MSEQKIPGYSPANKTVMDFLLCTFRMNGQTGSPVYQVLKAGYSDLLKDYGSSFGFLSCLLINITAFSLLKKNILKWPPSIFLVVQQQCAALLYILI
ncbi:hypothetical protein HGH92_26830 [Chitinophaga varians]|uniref:Uncharacterized protein n=1 Tax=Chitinophaga varians TaxID=2202339 RepID=A0A847RLR6_9BACT|nr:hypothetical protein [Chitinophaga varians]NLR67949.1 hypothetical protein [Chitinophaga varians]